MISAFYVFLGILVFFCSAIIAIGCFKLVTSPQLSTRVLVAEDESSIGAWMIFLGMSVQAIIVFVLLLRVIGGAA